MSDWLFFIGAPYLYMSDEKIAEERERACKWIEEVYFNGVPDCIHLIQDLPKTREGFLKQLAYDIQKISLSDVCLFAPEWLTYDTVAIEFLLAKKAGKRVIIMS